MKIFSKILIIFLSLNIIFTSFYPALLVTVVYGQEEWDFNEATRDTDAEVPAPEESAPVEEPVPEADTQPADIGQNTVDDSSSAAGAPEESFEQMMAREAAIQAELASQREEDAVNNVQENTQPVLTAQEQFDQMMEQAAIQAELISQQERAEAYARQQEEALSQDLAQGAVGSIDGFFDKSEETLRRTGESMSKLSASAYEQLLARRQDEAEQKRLMEELGIVEQTAQRSEEQYQQDLQKAIDAPVEERVARMREVLGLPKGTLDDTAVKNTFQQAAKDIGINVTMDGDIDSFTITLSDEELKAQDEFMDNVMAVGRDVVTLGYFSAGEKWLELRNDQERLKQMEASMDPENPQWQTEYDQLKEKIQKASDDIKMDLAVNSAFNLVGGTFIKAGGEVVARGAWAVLKRGSEEAAEQAAKKGFFDGLKGTFKKEGEELIDEGEQLFVLARTGDDTAVEVGEKAIAEVVDDTTKIGYQQIADVPTQTLEASKSILTQLIPSSLGYSNVESVFEKELVRISELLDQGIPEERLLAKAKIRGDAFANPDFNVGLSRIVDAERYYLDAPSGAGREVDDLEALLLQEDNFKAAKPAIDKAREAFNAARADAIKYGADPNKLPNFDDLVDPQDFYVVSADKIDPEAKYIFGRHSVVLREDSVDKGITVCHEFGHCAFDIGLADREKFRIMLGGKENTDKFEEMLTESFAQYAYKLAGKEPESLAYKAEVAVGDKLAEILKSKVGSIERARAMITEAQLSGQPEQIIFKTLGNGDENAGAKVMVDLLAKIPETVTDIEVGRLITRYDIAKASAVVVAALAAGGLIETTTPENPQPSSTPAQHSWKLIPDVFAKEDTTGAKPKTADTQAFEMLVKKQLIKDDLEQDGKVDSDFVKTVLKTDIIEPKVEKINGGYELTTGRAGIVESEIDEGVYTVSVASLPDKDISVPKIVTVAKGANAVIPIKVKQGSGKVEKDQDAIITNKISIAIVSEDNQVLPWAGVTIKMTKVAQEKGINLNNGWNLVTLAALPAKAMTASILLAEIAKQGGYATTVSSLDNGFWKSYVVRGDKTYSGEDFGIEPGKAYFVKAEKKSTFTFAGQNFVAPVKLKLASGWNAVGMPFTSKPYKAADLPVDMSARWESGLWDTFVKKQQEEFGENFVIANNRGYLVRLEQGGEFSP